MPGLGLPLRGWIWAVGGGRTFRSVWCSCRKGTPRRTIRKVLVRIALRPSSFRADLTDSSTLGCRQLTFTLRCLHLTQPSLDFCLDSISSPFSPVLFRTSRHTADDGNREHHMISRLVGRAIHTRCGLFLRDISSSGPTTWMVGRSVPFSTKNVFANPANWFCSIIIIELRGVTTPSLSEHNTTKKGGTLSSKQTQKAC